MVFNGHIFSDLQVPEFHDFFTNFGVALYGCLGQIHIVRASKLSINLSRNVCKIMEEVL